MERLTRLYSKIKNAYTELNPSTLSGAMDIIVIEQPDGSLHCSPFHVRFGKLSVPYPKDQKVKITVNGKKVPFTMTLEKGGKAFFETNEKAVTYVLELVLGTNLYKRGSIRQKKKRAKCPFSLFGNGCTNPFVSSTRECHTVKSIELSSNQLKQLGLVKGTNIISYSVVYRGKKTAKTATCTAKVFLWDHNVNLVISDVDGTITKSDTRGHLLPLIGRDWTHEGIAKLYTKINNNGYQFIYLTSRSIGQADKTRRYLNGILQHGDARLPEGPVLMSPDRLFESFHREVIMKKPDLFKTACLKNICQLFDQTIRNKVFYSGFGNRPTDAVSYRNVSIPGSRIFTTNSKGKLKVELFEGFISSYVDLDSLVYRMFPSVTSGINDGVASAFIKLLTSLSRNRTNEYDFCTDLHFPILETNSSNSRSSSSIHSNMYDSKN